MNQQQNAALESMKEWLAHPDELGKEPAKIELAGEFDLHELHYYIFKYKKSILGKWLLGVCGGYEPGETEHCGHVFSEMEPYEETTAKEKAIAMVEMIRSYWMEQAQNTKPGKWKRIMTVQKIRKEMTARQAPFWDLCCFQSRNGTFHN